MRLQGCTRIENQGQSQHAWSGYGGSRYLYCMYKTETAKGARIFRSSPTICTMCQIPYNDLHRFKELDWFAGCREVLVIRVARTACREWQAARGQDVAERIPSRNLQSFQQLQCCSRSGTNQCGQFSPHFLQIQRIRIRIACACAGGVMRSLPTNPAAIISSPHSRFAKGG